MAPLLFLLSGLHNWEHKCYDQRQLLPVAGHKYCSGQLFCAQERQCQDVYILGESRAHVVVPSIFRMKESHSKMRPHSRLPIPQKLQRQADN